MIWVILGTYLFIGFIFGVLITATYSGERDSKVGLAIIATALIWPILVVYLFWPGK